MDAFPWALLLISVLAWPLKGLFGWLSRLSDALRSTGDCPCRSILLLKPFGPLAALVGSFLPRSRRLGNYHAGFSRKYLSLKAKRVSNLQLIVNTARHVLAQSFSGVLIRCCGLVMLMPFE